MFRSRPSDLDLVAWTRSGLDLILCVKLGSGGSGSLGARGGLPELCSVAALDRSMRSGGYRGSFGLRFGAKERTRHAWSTGVDSGVLRGSEQGARRWGRLGVAAHVGGVTGLHQNGDSGLAFERNLIRKRERDILN